MESVRAIVASSVFRNKAMYLSAISNWLVYAEPVLWLLALGAFLRSKSGSRFSALGVFLWIRAVSTLLLLAIYRAPELMPHIDGHILYICYYCVYWSSYFLSAIAVYMTLQQVFRDAMSPLPGLKRIGTVGFRWMAVVSLIATSASVLAGLPSAISRVGCTHIAMDVARCVSIMELCVLAFFAIFIHSLGLSFRSRTFGISLGFGLMAVMDLVVSALNSDLYSWENQLSEVVTVLALIVWVAYFLAPEPARQPVAQVASPRLMHWNDLAMAIERNTPERAATSATGQQGGFLKDVEGVVDRVLAKNSVNNG